MIEPFFLFFLSPFCCMLFVLNSCLSLGFSLSDDELFIVVSLSGQVPCTEHQAVDFGPLLKTAQRYLTFCILLFCWIVVMNSECSLGTISLVLYLTVLLDCCYEQ